MARRFEFWCRECGQHFYLEEVTISFCRNPNCKSENVLELSAVVEMPEHLQGMMGMENVTTNRIIVDKRKR